MYTQHDSNFVRKSMQGKKKTQTVGNKQKYSFYGSRIKSNYFSGCF